MTKTEVRKKRRQRLTRDDIVFNTFNYILIFFFVAVTLYPLIYVVSASISEPTKVNSGQMWLWPVGFTTVGYEKVFRDPDIWLGYRNTIFYTVAGTLLNLAFTLPCAYALTKKTLPFKSLINFVILFTMFFSGGLIPLYMLVNNMGLMDTI